MTCQNNCFSLNIYSYIWKIFNGHHRYGKWQEIREKGKCLWTDRCCIPSPTDCSTSLPSLGSLLIPGCFTAPRREKLIAGAGVIMGRRRLRKLLHRHLLHAVRSLWDTHAPPPCSLPSPDYWPLEIVLKSCGVGFQTSSYCRFPLCLWTMRKAIHRSSVGQLGHTTGSFHLRE